MADAVAGELPVPAAVLVPAMVVAVPVAPWAPVAPGPHPRACPHRGDGGRLVRWWSVLVSMMLLAMAKSITFLSADSCSVTSIWA